MMKNILAVLFLVLLAGGCSETVVVVIDNETDRPVVLRTDVDRTIGGKGSIELILPGDQYLQFVLANGELRRYRVSLPRPEGVYVSKRHMTLTLELLLAEDGKLYAVKVGHSHDRLDSEQPRGFPLQAL